MSFTVFIPVFILIKRSVPQYSTWMKICGYIWCVFLSLRYRRYLSFTQITNNMNPVNTTVTVHVYVYLALWPLKLSPLITDMVASPPPTIVVKTLFVCVFFILVGTQNSLFIFPVMWSMFEGKHCFKTTVRK